MGAPVIAAIILRKERDVVDHFRTAGALSPATANSLDAMGVSQAFPLNRLRRRAIIREAAPGRYYLDEEVWYAVRGMRQRMVLLLLSVLLVTFFLVWIGFVTLR